jgi:hypothetical protein
MLYTSTKELERRLMVMRSDITADTEDKIRQRMVEREQIELELQRRWIQDEPLAAGIYESHSFIR